MNSEKLDSFYKSFLDFKSFESVDSSLNGLQVDNDGTDIKKAAFGVDASLEIFERVVKCGAGMLFVHHGLFWGHPLRITGSHRERLKFLLEHNLALYAVHLPLDQHPELGNNAALASLLGIQQPEPFGEYHGKKIGYKGNLTEPLNIDEAVKKISFMNRPPLSVFPFGVKENRTVAVVSGGAPYTALEAIDEGIDLYVTGETSHSIYHQALEGHLNLIAGGHYSTEVWGVRRVMEKTTRDTGLEVEFIDVPTGL